MAAVDIIPTDDPMSTIAYIRKPKSPLTKLREEGRTKAEADKLRATIEEESSGDRFHRLFAA